MGPFIAQIHHASVPFRAFHLPAVALLPRWGSFPFFWLLCTELSNARGRSSAEMEKQDKHLVPFALEKHRSLSPAGSFSTK